ncbi:MAG: metallophosphoesterase [Pseudomonadota bacterium]
MIIKDLGALEGPVLLYGGPYSNLQATRAVFAMADVVGIAPPARICTGDVVAYCADPVDTARLVLAEGGALVAGNCERQLAAGAQDCGCGFDGGSTCDILSKGWYPHALRALMPHDDIRAAFAAAPDIAVFAQGAKRFAVIHGGLSDIARFIWSTSPDAVFAEEIALIEAAAGPIDGVIAGHSGMAFTRSVGRHLWINAGVIGMPANNARQSTAFAILENASPRIGKLSYDAETAAAAMVAAGLTQGYDAALITGLWPSEDVLPSDLKRVSV